MIVAGYSPLFDEIFTVQLPHFLIYSEIVFHFRQFLAQVSENKGANGGFFSNLTSMASVV